MPQWSEWRSCAHDGTLPAELLPSALWQLRWFVQWQFGGGGGFTTTPTRGEWEWEFLRGALADFDEQVKVSGYLVTLYGILSTWLPDNPDINTLVPVKPSILGADPDRWTWDAVKGHWVNPAQQGYFTDVTCDLAVGGFLVEAWYTSNAYEIPLDVGETAKVPFHNIGGQWLRFSLSNLQIRTVRSTGFATLVDAPGFHRIIRPAGSSSEQVFSGDWRNFTIRRLPYKLDSPSVAKDLTNALLVVGKRAAGGWLLAKSGDDGLTWEDGGTVFPDNYADVRATVNRDGVIVAVGRLGGAVRFRSGYDGFVTETPVGLASSACQIACDQSSGALVVTDGKQTEWASRDGGRSWAAVTML